MAALPNPVDRVEILTVVDNVLDLLLSSTDVAKRMGPGGREGQPTPAVEAPLLESGQAQDTPVAEHYELVQQLGLRGTPAIFTESGRLISGYVPAEEMLEILEEPAS